MGVFKINVRYEAKPIDASNDTKDEEADGESTENGDFSSMERRARMIMRTDGVHKVVLNSLIFKEMNVGTPEGEEPTGRTMHLTGLEDGRPRGFQIRVSQMKDSQTPLTFAVGQRRSPQGPLPQDTRTEVRVMIFDTCPSPQQPHRYDAMFYRTV